jgi:hypothetical protein
MFRSAVMMTMRPVRLNRRLLALCAALLACALCSPMAAQYDPTESRSAELSAFGGFSVVQPDYYTASNKGVSAGLAFTRFFDRLPVEPSLAIRGTYASGVAVTERTISGGLQISKRYRRFHPYADILIGGATIVFAVKPEPNDHEDKGRVFSFGGGLDVDLVHNLRARFDLQAQAWNLGLDYPLTGSNTEDFTLSPTAFTIGINYVLPFKPRVSYSNTR